MKTLILDYLIKFPEGKTPTQIGMALGRNYSTASAAVSGALKSLIKEGKVKKLKIDKKVKYVAVSARN